MSGISTRTKMSSKISTGSTGNAAIIIVIMPGRDWEKPENYDLLINTTQIGVDGAVQLIKDYLKMRGLL